MSHPIQSCLAFPHRAASNIARSLALTVLCWLSFQVFGYADEPDTVLYSFSNSGTTHDGENPYAGLIQASNCNFYGTTSRGSSGNEGTIFEMTPSGTLTTLHSFDDGTYAYDGYTATTSLVQVPGGALFGVTQDGGGASFGTIFTIHPDGTSYSVITNLSSSVPNSPVAPLIFGTDGYLYGTFESGGPYESDGGGAAFQLDGGNGAVNIVHNFGYGTDGIAPEAPLIQDPESGNFYGTTVAGGGSSSNGTVFKIVSGIVTTLYSFDGGANGYDCTQGVVLGSDGSLYGMTQSGGVSIPHAAGIAYKITSPKSASPTFTVLHTFADGTVTNDGVTPLGGFIQATDGNFYGTTFSGGSANEGTVFQMTPSGTITILHSFTGSGDGSSPRCTLIQGSDGYLYGTTQSGGASGLGTVFKIALPISFPTWVTQNGLTGESASPTATLEPDLLTNLLKYSLGLNPATNYNPNDAGLPYTSVQSFSGTDFLTLTFNGVAPDVTYEVQASSDLTGAWSTIYTYSSGKRLGPGTVTVQDTQPVTTSSQRYMRLLLTYSTTTVSTVPEGYFTSSAAAGTLSTPTQSVLSFPLQGIATASGQMVGIVTGLTSSTITNSNASWTAGQLSSASSPYFIEFTSGAAAGRTFVISSSTANTSTSVTIDSTDASLTDLTTLGIVTGTDTYKIIPGSTLLSAFGTPTTTGILGGTSATAADNIQINNGVSWMTYYYNTTMSEWIKTSLPAPSNNVLIRPNYGAICIRRSSTLNLAFPGQAPVTALQAMVSNSGTTAMSNNWPTNYTLSTSNIVNIPGWVTGSQSVADEVEVYNPITDAWQTYYNNGTDWMRTGIIPINGDSVAIPSGSMFLISKLGSATGISIFSQPVPYSF